MNINFIYIPSGQLTQSKSTITHFLPRSSVELLFMLYSILNVWVGENTNIQNVIGEEVYLKRFLEPEH